MIRLSTVSLLAGALFLSACGTYDATTPGGMDTPDFGNAVRTNIAAQTVHPDAGSKDTPIKASGALTGIAQDRYVHDHVKQPSPPTTSTLGGDGSSGSGTSAGSSSGTK